MRYLLAILCPPLAILLCGRLFLAIFSILLTACFYFPGALVALLVVSATLADERNRTLIIALDKSSKAQLKAVERETRKLVEAMKDQQKTQVAAAQAPQTPSPQTLPPPRKPLLTMDQIRGAIAASRDGIIGAKDGAIFAYQNLPEWAQPIAWGLAAGTFISVGMTTIFLVRR